MKDENFLVTGGAGVIGSHLVDRLIREKPRNLVVVDNFFLGKTANLKEAKKAFPELKVYNQDVCNQKEMKKIIEDNRIRVIFDLAVLPLPMSLVQPRLTFEKNVEMTLSMCELLREDAYEKLIHFSSSEVYGSALYDPMDEKHHLGSTTPYAASKAASDLLVQSYGSTYGTYATIVRPFNNYGPRQNDESYAGIIPITIKRIAAGENPIIFGTGEQTRDYTYVTDTAEVTVNIYKNPKTRGKILNVGSGKEASILELVKLIVKHTDCKKPIRFENKRPGDVMRHVADISELKKYCDYSPKVELNEGVKRTVEWYLKKLKTNGGGVTDHEESK